MRDDQFAVRGCWVGRRLLYGTYGALADETDPSEGVPCALKHKTSRSVEH
jgi:hypothetical protein